MMNPISPPEKRFEAYSMDFIGPLPKTSEGYDSICMIVDTFTKLILTTPIKMTYGAKEVAEIVMEKIVSRFGMPGSIRSDRDPRFTSKFWRRLWESYRTKLQFTMAYHPRANRQME